MMSEELNSAQSKMSAAQAFGAKLIAAREAVEMSRGDIVTRLCMAQRQVEALENGQFDKLPEPVYVHAFIRGYAGAVGVDYRPWVVEYDRITGIKGPVFMNNALDMNSLSSVPDTVVLTRNHNHKAVWAAVAVAVVVGLGYAGWLAWPQVEEVVTTWFGGEDKPTAVIATTTNIAPVAPESASAAPEGDKPPAPPAGEPVVAPQPATDAAPAAAAPAAAAAAPAPAAESAPAPSPAVKGRNVFVIAATDESWCRIVDANGARLFDRIVQAGETVSIGSDLGMRVTIGRITAVKLTHNGREVDLKSRARPSGTALYEAK